MSEERGAPLSRTVLGMRVHATSYADAAERITGWAQGRESRYVCVAPVHTVMECHDSAEFRAVLNSADLVTPDGMPVVWALRMLGVREASRVYGPDLTPVLCAAAAERGIPVGFYGGSSAALAGTVRRLKERVPGLQVPYAESPPFRALDAEEERAVADAINASGARILFIGLGCPKQELWMARHRGRIEAVMVGVGAAFDFIAGTKRQAPRFLMRIGMEWAFRLLSEPRRLAWRYLYHNPRFVYFLGRQLLSARRRLAKLA